MRVHHLEGHHMKPVHLRISLFFLIVVWITAALPLFSEDLDLNEYYKFPLSLAVAYQPITGIGNTSFLDFQINEIAAEVRYPIPGLPILQPLVRGGIIDFSFIADPGDSGLDWTHRHFFGTAGLGLSHRFSQDFEIGFELFGGASQSVFSNLESEIYESSTSHGQINIVAGGGASFSINPSFNFSICVMPSVRYFHGLGALDTYNGFAYGVGFQGSYRFGADPDRSTASIRAVRFSEIEMPPVFAAMRSYYAREPITTFEIENAEKFEIQDLIVEFFQEGFMDSPTMLAQIDQLAEGETKTIDLIATYSEDVYSTQGTTPLNGEIVATYTAQGKSSEQRRSVSYELYDKNALTWDNDRKVAAFITPADSAIRNYASFVRLIHREVQNPYVSEPLQVAMQAFNALAVQGILYQIDPISPFTEMQENKMIVDSISLPRETLVRLTGDCDDLTVLFNTILQSAGIETAFVTTPAHIYSAVNTKVASKDFAAVHPDRDMLVEIRGEIWVLVEITLIGKASFMEAWSTGIAEYKEHDNQPEQRGLYLTNESQQLFRPVALREVDLGLQYGDEETIVSRFENDLENLSRVFLQPAADDAQTENTAKSWNKYGIAAAKFGAMGEAVSGFERAVEIDPDYLHARLNLGSLYYLAEDYTDALTTFQEALESIEAMQRVRESLRFKVLLNMSRAHYALEQYDDAREYFAIAKTIDSDMTAEYSYLGPSSGEGPGQGRASDAAAAEPILFFED
jgi:hypothetical protein